MGIISWLFGRKATADQASAERVLRNRSATMTDKADVAQANHGKPKLPSSKIDMVQTSGIPQYRKELLFLAAGDPPSSAGSMMSFVLTSDGLMQESTPDPSTIYSTLPVSDGFRGEVPKMGYFPSYFKMTPDQRATYLAWLCDVTMPIDIGYVFVYYYGLERHLVYGNFEAAVNEVLLLRKHHQQGSFLAYSSSALVHGCLIRKRADMLMHLYEDLDFDYFGNSSLLLLHVQGLDLTPDMLVRLSIILQIKGVSRKYIKENIDIYREALIAELRDEFGVELYPFGNNCDLSQVKGISYPLFANISFPDQIGAPSLPNLLHYEPFLLELGAFFAKVHGRTKGLKRARRNSSSSTSLIDPPRLPE